MTILKIERSDIGNHNITVDLNQQDVAIILTALNDAQKDNYYAIDLIANLSTCFSFMKYGMLEQYTIEEPIQNFLENHKEKE